MSITDVDYYNPYTLLGNVQRAAVEAEGDFVGVIIGQHFLEYAEYYEDLFGRLAYTYGGVALQNADTLATASDALREEASDEFGTRVEAIRTEALTHWEGDGAASFTEYLNTIEDALQHQYETALTLENLLRLHGSLVLAAKEKVIFLAEQTVEALEERQQQREAEQAARLQSLKNNIIAGLSVGVTVGGPFGLVVGVATGLGGYIVDETTRVVQGDDAFTIIRDMAASMTEVYQEFNDQEGAISTALTQLSTRYLTPTGQSSVEGSPLVPRYLSEYLHGDADVSDVYNHEEWITD